MFRVKILMLLLLFPVELQLLVSHMINHVFYFYRVLFLAAPKVAEVPPPAEPVEVAQDEEDWDKEDEVEVIQKVEEKVEDKPKVEEKQEKVEEAKVEEKVEVEPEAEPAEVD